MNNMRSFRLLIFLFSFSCFLTAKGQNDSLANLTRREIKLGFENYKKHSGVVMIPELENQLKSEYLLKSLNMQRQYYSFIKSDSVDIFSKKLDEMYYNAVVKFSRSAGVEQVLSIWMGLLAANKPVVMSIGDFFKESVEIELGAMQKIDTYESNISDKYATIVVNTVPFAEYAQIYLDGKLLCTLGEAKNGIRVMSNQKYKIFLRFNNKNYCAEYITLSSQERRMKFCSINK